MAFVSIMQMTSFHGRTPDRRMAGVFTTMRYRVALVVLICDDRASICHRCDLEPVVTWEGTRDIHHLVLGNALTGQSAFR